MNEICTDLLNEYNELLDLAKGLTPAQWGTRSKFYGWTPWDEIAHLCFFDETGLLACTDPDAFAIDMRVLSKQLAEGMEISGIARARYGHMAGPALTSYWRERFQALVDVLATLDPKARLPWYGPTMSARSFATARLMETWAHGQDVFDAVRVRRAPSMRLRHIAHIGVTTFGWAFVNRKLPIPETVPYIELAAPDGKVWTWNTPSSKDYVRGNAEDFCLVVTQRRHVADTCIRFSGGAAHRWLEIAQCFAGPPADGPLPGERVVDYSLMQS